MNPINVTKKKSTFRNERQIKWKIDQFIINQFKVTRLLEAEEGKDPWTISLRGTNFSGGGDTLEDAWNDMVEHMNLSWNVASSK